MEEPCKLWMGAKTKKGYGVLMFNGKAAFVHRLSYRLFYGSIPAGMMVCHKCDVRNCINPKHLFLGTGKDNSDDMTIKGRGLYGRSPVEIENIVTKERNVFQTQKEAGDFIDVTQSNICYAIKNKTIISKTYKAEWHNKNQNNG